MPQKKISLGVKILLLGLQCSVLMIGASIIWLMSYSRDERNNEVAEQIVNEWGESVYIDGPAAKENLDSTAWIRPNTFNCVASVGTKSLHRNIYEAEVFNANLRLNGTFNRDSLMTMGDTLYVEIGVPTKRIDRLSPLKIGEKTVNWSKSAYSMFAKVNIVDMPEILEISTDFDIRGSKSLFIKPVGEESIITIEGEAPNPSFNGRSLPNERSLHGKQFFAKWEGEGVPVKVGSGEREYVGVNFLIGVDRYQKVARSLKYSLLIIVLTYISVLLTETVTKRNIPLLNYFLIGAALILFYSLLLSFTEQMSFGLSYLIASSMTVALISGYMWKMIASRKVGLTMGGILALLYLSCYILLTLSNFALLLGSMILFIALAAMMYYSLQSEKQ